MCRFFPVFRATLCCQGFYYNGISLFLQRCRKLCYTSGQNLPFQKGVIKMDVKITGKTRLTGLLGSPVSHSLSPAMHNRAFQFLRLDYVYLCFDVMEKDLKTAVEGLKICGIRGFNCTMPDKNRMLELTDSCSKAAEMIGAVNTVLNEGGILTGYNTDGIGFMRAAAENGFIPGGKADTILGAGGAATAIAVQAALDGISHLTIAARPGSRFHNRTVSLLDSISRNTGCQTELTDIRDRKELERNLSSSDLLVQATPVGMPPATGQTILDDFSSLKKGALVADLIYNPRQTTFLKLAEASGFRTFNGLRMLLYQGAEAFRIWTGRDMPTEEVLPLLQ